jgi:clan AA aspartic protease
MGTFHIPIDLGNEQGTNWRTLDALVDTGASTTSIPGSILRELGVRPISTERFRFAQGEVRELPVGYTWIRFAGKELMTQVIFNAEGTSPLLGALALEAAYVAVDPVGQRLLPVDGLLM